MKKKLFYLIVALFISSCGNQPKNGKAPTLALNEGEKWEVTAEMKPHITQSLDILQDYISKGEKDYKGLANKLENQNSRLIKSCNMKGPGHDELHKWLLPYMAMIENLGKAKSDEDALVIIKDLEKSFDQYKNYFN